MRFSGSFKLNQTDGKLCAESMPANRFQLSPDEEDNDGFQVVQPEVTTVAEEVDRMNKADLMRKFKLAVTIYMYVTAQNPCQFNFIAVD